MKRAVIFITLFYSTAYAQRVFNRSFGTKELSFLESKAFSRLQNAKNASASADFRVSHYRCEWHVDPAVRFISGRVAAQFVTTVPTDNLVFDLSDSLTVDSVTQRNRRLSFTHSGNALKIRLLAAMTTGALDSVQISYHGVPASTGFGSFVNSVHDSVPVIWTLSEPYGARDWWPCRNGLSDKADSIDVYIYAPAKYTAASNGLRESVTIVGNTAVTHWRHRYPIATYLVCMAVTNFSEFENHVTEAAGDLLMQTFCYPEDLLMFQQNTPLVLSTVGYFSQLLGPYPFIKEKYGQVEFGWGGGMEHQTSTFIVTPNETLMAHELSHQWFGDKVTCGSWHDVWLNEGFATQMTSMDAEVLFPQYTLYLRKKEIGNITSLPGGSVYVDDTTSVSRIFDSRLTYTKGSHLLFMLRWILGDSVFFRGVREYLNDPTLTYGFATTRDLQRNLEKASGRSLGYFFREWFYGQGYPSYHIEWSQLDDHFVRIKINQITSDPSVKFFELPVALQFKNATNQKTVIVNDTINNQVFIRDIGFAADTLLIDPDYWLISAGNTARKIEETIPERIEVFPSPFNNEFYINLRNFPASKMRLRIYDAKGALMNKDQFQVDNSLLYQVSTDNYTPGIYFIDLETDNGVKFAKKILKQ